MTFGDVVNVFERLNNKTLFYHNFDIMDKEISEDFFVKVLMKWLGYTSEEKYNEFINCSRGESSFTKGDAYLMICHALDGTFASGEDVYETVFDNKTTFRNSFLPPYEITLYVSSFNDLLNQYNECLNFCPERIVIVFKDDCSESDKTAIYRHFLEIYYSWRNKYGNNFDYEEVFLPTSDVFWGIKYNSELYSKELDELTTYPEIYNELLKLTENLKESGEDENKIEIEYKVKLFELCDDKTEISMWAGSYYEHMYLNLDIKNDWLYCYNNREYIETIKEFAEKNLSPLLELSDYDKILQINRIICNNTSYDYAEERLLNSDNWTWENSHWWTHEISGFFTHESIVCDGYAFTFSWMADYLNIESYVVYGGMSGTDVSHAWNKVKINDNWYNIDVCWADTGEGMRFFLKSDNFYSNNRHIFEDRMGPDIPSEKSY